MMRWSCTLFLLLPVGCGADWTQSDPATWALEDMGPFSLRLPPDFDQVPKDGTDSLVLQYDAADGEASVRSDFGWYSDDLAPEPTQYSEYNALEEEIGGRPALVVTGVLTDPTGYPHDGPFVAAAAWADVYGDNTPMPIKLTIYVQMRDVAHEPLMLTLLRSVAFDPR